MDFQELLEIYDQGTARAITTKQRKGSIPGKRCQECAPPPLIQWQVSLAQKGHVALMTNLALAKKRALLGTGGSVDTAGQRERDCGH